MKTLAIFSPNQNGYSETFIQAHKNLPFAIKYYYGSWLPDKMEGFKSLYDFNITEKVKYKINKNLNVSEHALSFSLKKEKVDCVLAEYGPTASATLKVVKGLKIPMIVHFHGFDASRNSTLDEFAKKYLEVFDYAYKIIAVSQRMKNDLIRLGCAAEKIEITACGPNPVFFHNIPTYDNLQFAAVGRFTEKKGPRFTILAFEKVIKLFPQAKLVMAGDGELWEECKNLVEKLNLSKSIEFTGALTPTEVKNLLQVSVAFVQHSVVAENGDSEGTPVAVLEAQAAALPVISTCHAGIPDVIIQNETGLLVEEKDVEGMSNNMLRILQEDGLAKKMGIYGRNRIKENFSMEIHLKTLEQIINKAIVN